MSEDQFGFVLDRSTMTATTY